MANFRDIEIAGKTLIIYDHDIPLDTDADLSGASLSDCAIILANYLPIYARTHPLSAVTVLEIGAGTGLPGLVAAALGSPRVILTDRPHLLPGLARNVEANSGSFPPSTNTRVALLEWGRVDHVTAFEFLPLGLLLMSDVLYDVPSARDLCRTMKAVASRRTPILMAYELRRGTTECFEVFIEEGFGWTKLSREELDPDWQSNDIGVFRVYYL